jgi:hypothetical protein
MLMSELLFQATLKECTPAFSTVLQYKAAPFKGCAFRSVIVTFF